MSAENRRQMWVPAGFAHGRLVLSASADVICKVTDHQTPDWDRAIRWSDPDLGIDWPLDGADPILSAKEAAAPVLGRADLPD